jgi:hypothetical protein
VSIPWDVHLTTWYRWLLAGPIRKRQLCKEIADSLTALANHVKSVSVWPTSQTSQASTGRFQICRDPGTPPSLSASRV